MKPIAAAFALFALALPGTTLACTCIQNLDVPRAVDKSTRVFRGTVTAIERHDGMLQRVTFQVSEHFKGAPATIVQVENHASGPMCGYPFQQGIEYVVYAHGEDRQLQTSSCSRTTVAVEPSSELDALRAAR